MLGWDRGVLAAFAAACGVDATRLRLHDAGRAGQRAELVGWPFRRAVRCCPPGPAAGAVARLRAAGYLWRLATGWRPAGLVVHSAPWVVPPATMWRSGDRTFHILFEVGRESGVKCRLRVHQKSGGGFLSPRMAQAAFSAFDRVPGLIGWRSPCGAALALKTVADVDVVLGACVEAGAADGMADGLTGAAWLVRKPQTVAEALTAAGFAGRYERAFGRGCPPGVLRAAGF